jgi:hypothetical protein
MTRRICGCRDDSLVTKRMIYHRANQVAIHDDGRQIYIGIIFHICYRNYNQSDVGKDVDNAIDLLNKDFSKQCQNFNYGSDKYKDRSFKQTFDSYVQLSDKCNISFYKVNILYSPVEIQNSSNTSILDRNIKKNSPAINPERYLNVWVADLGGGLLGYAQFPWDDNPKKDGVVISKDTFGRKPNSMEYNLGKTLTHEIGHWLGLYHIFQETIQTGGQNTDPDNEEHKGDCIADTPPQATPTYGNPVNTPNDWPCSQPIDEKKAYRHMFMNFMDYTDDIALFMFTHDQVKKIRQMIHVYRPKMLDNIAPRPILIKPTVVQPAKPKPIITLNKPVLNPTIHKPTVKPIHAKIIGPKIKSSTRFGYKNN